MARGKARETPKQLVWEAYQKVKANRGAAGVDGQSLAALDEDLKGNLYKVSEPDVVGPLLQIGYWPEQPVTCEHREDESPGDRLVLGLGPHARFTAPPETP